MPYSDHYWSRRLPIRPGAAAWGTPT